MRDNLEEKLEAGVDAASLSRIRVRRPKETESTPRKVKSGDITDRLQDLADELEASRPDMPRNDIPTPEIATSVRAGRPEKSKIAPGTIPARIPLKQRKATTKRALEPEIGRPQETAPEPALPVSSLPPRRLNRARPAAVSGWQKKPATPDILSYWMDIRGGKRYPDWHNLDTAMIGRHWPNCTLVQCDHILDRLQIENGFADAVRQATRAENPERDVNSEVEFSPMVVDWVLSLAREVANSGKPTHGTEYFPSSFDEVTLRVIALPLSEDQVNIDHVLCYVQKLD